MDGYGECHDTCLSVEKGSANSGCVAENQKKYAIPEETQSLKPGPINMKALEQRPESDNEGEDR